MKTIKYKAWCIIEITDDLKGLPFLSRTKREALWGGRSHFGHPCDDPQKRGVLAQCELTLKVPPMPPVTDELMEYVRAFKGKPALFVLGDRRGNKRAFRNAKVQQQAILKKLRRARQRGL